MNASWISPSVRFCHVLTTVIASQVLAIMVLTAEAVLAASPTFFVFTIDVRLSMDRLHVSLEISLSANRLPLASLVNTVREVAVEPLLRTICCGRCDFIAASQWHTVQCFVLWIPAVPSQ